MRCRAGLLRIAALDVLVECVGAVGAREAAEENEGAANQHHHHRHDAHQCDPACDSDLSRWRGG